MLTIKVKGASETSDASTNIRYAPLHTYVAEPIHVPNAVGRMTIINNNIADLQDLTVNSFDNLQSELDIICKLKDTELSLCDTYTKSEVNQQINNLIDAAPTQLNTLNELATALNDDSNFATTITNSIATKQPLLTNTGGMGSTVFNCFFNSIMQIYSISPVQTSFFVHVQSPLIFTCTESLRANINSRCLF